MSLRRDISTYSTMCSTKARIWYPWNKKCSSRTLRPRWSWWVWPRGPGAPCGPAEFVLASVSDLGSPHLCWALLIFPPVSCSSHGLGRPPPGPHPGPGSASAVAVFVSVWTRMCAQTEVLQPMSRGHRTAVTSALDPWEVSENAKNNRTFLIFPSMISVIFWSFGVRLR